MNPLNPDLLGLIQGVTGRTNQRFQLSIAKSRFDRGIVVGYSAAAASDGFTFAADNMKSEMRGTISDLKREPLNTP